MNFLRKPFCLNLAIGGSFFMQFYTVLIVLTIWSGGAFRANAAFFVPLLIGVLVATAYITAPLNSIFRACPRIGVAVITAIQAYLGLLSFEVGEYGLAVWPGGLMAPIVVALYTAPYLMFAAGTNVCFFSKYLRPEVKNEIV